MKIVIDTNSLLSLVRYYLPFDNENHLIDFFQSKIASGNIVIIDKVYQQCQYQAKGLILEKLDFLTEKDFLKESNKEREKLGMEQVSIFDFFKDRSDYKDLLDKEREKLFNK